MNNQPIGILDSGVGGLSIWQEIVSQLPNESTIYIADSKHCPYGARSADEIEKLARPLVGFLIDQKVKLIVIACNTITVSCLNKLREEFVRPPIVGIVPVVKTAVERTKTKRIGVLSTTATAKSDHQKKLIETFAKSYDVTSIGTDKLVPFVERGEVDSEQLQTVLKQELREFVEKQIDTLALGCSHFPFLKGSMQRMLGQNVSILDSAGAIARQVGRVLTNNSALSLKNHPTHQFFTTGDKDQFRRIANKLLGDTMADNVTYVRF